MLKRPPPPPPLSLPPPFATAGGRKRKIREVWGRRRVGKYMHGVCMFYGALEGNLVLFLEFLQKVLTGKINERELAPKALSFLPLNIFKCPFPPCQVLGRVLGGDDRKRYSPPPLFHVLRRRETVGLTDRLWQRGADGADK